MRIGLLVAGAVPNLTASGGAVTAWTITAELLERSHDVAVVGLVDPEVYDPTAQSRDERVEAVRALGADVRLVPSEATTFFRTRPRGLGARLRRAWRPSDAELMPNLVDADAVADAVADAGIDAAFVYHFEMLAASRRIGVPRFAAVGDPPHLSALYRFRERLPDPRALRGAVWLAGQARHQPGVIVRLLNECDACGAFAAHHAAWLRERGATGCRYLHTPTPDPGPPFATGGSRDRPRILLVGHMKGVVTLEGLRLFGREVLPRLEADLGAEGFEVRIAGGYEPPPDVARMLDRPSVRRLGHVEHAEEEFRSAHVLLVPNSISLGIRVRIVTGFSFGTCVVTHRANTRGIPELADGVNALVAEDGQRLAEATLAALSDVALRQRLGQGARETYERAFAPPVAAGEILETLKRIARPVPAAT